MISLKVLGDVCRQHRLSRGYYQCEVAAAVGCSKENVSAFENGRNNNAKILLWYIQHGLTYDLGGLSYDDKSNTKVEY